MVKLNKAHIGIFGRTNVGKSSLVNAITGQETAVVSAVPGTTTDPVKKSIEILGIGPVVLIDTAGIDDRSVLGVQRISKTQEIFHQINLAIIVFDQEIGTYEKELAAQCRKEKVPFFYVHNKADLYPAAAQEIESVEVVDFSNKRGDTSDLISAIIRHLPKEAYAHDDIFGGFIGQGDEVVFVMPIDDSAPEGRLILPQVQSLRGLLDQQAVGVCLQPQQLEGWLKNHTPKLVVTDSQAFAYVSRVVPQEVALTSFSVLFSRLKGDFDLFLKGTPQIDTLQDGDRVLVLESCTHSVNVCDDIGRVKLPALLQKKTGKKLEFHFVTNLDPLPKNLSDYKLALQCGGCMVTRWQILSRMQRLAAAGVAVSNYGLAMAWCTGIFTRVTQIFGSMNVEKKR